MTGGLPGAARAAAAHVFVADLAEPELGDDDRHHLLRVLRLRPGETVSVADGLGSWRLCELGAAGELLPAGERVRIDVALPEVTVAFAVPKGDRAEWAVQKLTEVGVDRIIPLAAARSVVRWEGERADRHLARWEAVARQAAMQSRRARLPVVERPRRPADLAASATVALADPDGSAPSLDRATVLVGPEGGWSDDEAALGPPRVTLGPNVLRTETAAVVAGALLVALRSATTGVRPLRE
jgi:16S rRNA (uracil1498-N3)-methyltransferase